MQSPAAGCRIEAGVRSALFQVSEGEEEARLCYFKELFFNVIFPFLI